AQAAAGFFEIGVGLGETEAQQVLATFAEESFARNRGHPGRGEQMHGFFFAVAARQRRRVSKNVVGTLWPGRRESCLFQSRAEQIAFGAVLVGQTGVEVRSQLFQPRSYAMLKWGRGADVG